MNKNLNVFRCFSILLFGFGVAFHSAGCGSSSIQQPTYPVSGQVMLDGSPVVGASVVFVPIDNKKFRWAEQPQGLTDKEGKFQMYTYSSNDGAPAADYKVGIVLFEVAADDGGDQVKHDNSKPILPKKYADPNMSGLTVKVDSKANVLQSFNLTSSVN